MEDLSPDVLPTTLDEFSKFVEEDDSHIYEATLTNDSEETTTFQSISTRTAAEYVLKKYSQRVHFTCEDHAEWGMHYSTKIIINIFYNNKQKIAADSVRKDVVSGFKKRRREI